MFKLNELATYPWGHDNNVNEKMKLPNLSINKIMATMQCSYGKMNTNSQGLKFHSMSESAPTTLLIRKTREETRRKRNARVRSLKILLQWKKLGSSFIGERCIGKRCIEGDKEDVCIIPPYVLSCTGGRRHTPQDDPNDEHHTKKTPFQFLILNNLWNELFPMLTSTRCFFKPCWFH